MSIYGFKADLSSGYEKFSIHSSLLISCRNETSVQIYNSVKSCLFETSKECSLFYTSISQSFQEAASRATTLSLAQIKLFSVPY